MYELYGAYGSASFPAHVILEIVGEPYEFVEIDIFADKTPELLRLHPMGKVPILIKQVAGAGDMVMFEASAISTYLADLAPGHKLSPALSDPDRGRYLQWMAFLSTNLQERFYIWFYPERYVSDAAAVAAAKESARQRIDSLFKIVDDQLHDKSLLVGTELSACDLYLMMLVTWHGDRKSLYTKCPNVHRHFEAVQKHPMVEKLLPKYDK